MIDRIQETKLVKGISQGNIIAFNTMFREYGCRLYRFINGYIKTDSESEQIVQDVFMKIWEKRADLREELSFKSYLFTIAFNKIRKHFRAKAMISEYLHSGTEEESDMHTSGEITYNSLLGYVSEIVDQLPERRKLIFIKSRFEGRSIKEIAEDLKISHKTVENQLTDALKFIRTNLKKEELVVFFFAVLYFL